MSQNNQPAIVFTTNKVATENTTHLHTYSNTNYCCCNKPIVLPMHLFSNYTLSQLHTCCPIYTPTLPHTVLHKVPPTHLLCHICNYCTTYPFTHLPNCYPTYTLTILLTHFMSTCTLTVLLCQLHTYCANYTPTVLTTHLLCNLHTSKN